jgi:hypothetical protein
MYYCTGPQDGIQGLNPEAVSLDASRSSRGSLSEHFGEARLKALIARFFSHRVLIVTS